MGEEEAWDIGLTSAPVFLVKVDAPRCKIYKRKGGADLQEAFSRGAGSEGSSHHGSH